MTDTDAEKAAKDQEKAEAKAAKEREAADAKAAKERAARRDALAKDQAKADEEREREVAENETPEPTLRTAVYTVVLRDDNDQSRHDVTRLIVNYGGEVTEGSGRYLTVEVPTGSRRHPTQGHENFVAHLRADPLVAEVQG